MSFHFCCDIRLVGSESVANDMKAWIHFALVMLLVVVLL